MEHKETDVLCAMNLLTARDYTEKQLRDKLNKREYSSDEIQAAIDYVKSFHYVDDIRYAENYLEYYKEIRTYKRMENDLVKKGVAAELVRECWKHMLDEGTKYDEEVMIARLLEKKHFDKEHADYKEKQKMAAFLYRRGFRSDSIRKYLLLDIS